MDSILSIYGIAFYGQNIGQGIGLEYPHNWHWHHVLALSTVHNLGVLQKKIDMKKRRKIKKNKTGKRIKKREKEIKNEYPIGIGIGIAPAAVRSSPMLPAIAVVIALLLLVRHRVVVVGVVSGCRGHAGQRWCWCWAVAGHRASPGMSKDEDRDTLPSVLVAVTWRCPTQATGLLSARPPSKSLPDGDTVVPALVVITVVCWGSVVVPQTRGSCCDS